MRQDKPLVWLGSSREDLRGFPAEARRKVGVELRAVQRGQEPADFKPMSVVGSGTYELRIATETTHRVFYIAKYEEAVYVLHAFQKKTQKTSTRDLTIGQQRYQTLQNYRKKLKKEG